MWVGKNEGNCRVSEQSEGFIAGSGSENRITCSLQHGLAETKVGFVVLYAENGSLS